MATVPQTSARCKPVVYRKNRGPIHYARPVPLTPAQVADDLTQEFGADALMQARRLAAGEIVVTIFARYSIDPAALCPCWAHHAAATPPVWQRVANPATRNGTYGRDLVRGR